MLSVNLVAFIAAIPVLLVLIVGAISDYHSRLFPKEYWDVPAKISGFFTFVMYLMLFSMKEYQLIFSLIVTTIVFAITFYIIGMRFGSGGDYRALIYIAVLCPVLIIPTVIMALVFGINMVIVYRHYNQTAPWAVAILLGFFISMISLALVAFK